MTLVIGIEDKDGVVLASDSFVGDDDHRDTLDTPKWFRLGQIWVGYAGSFAVARTAEHAYKVPQPLPRERPTAYLYRVAQGIYSACREASVKPEDGFLLMAYRGKVYNIADGGAPVRSANGYAAIGAGELQALSALAATEDRKDTEGRARAVMHAVSRHCLQVSPPFHVIRV